MSEDFNQNMIQTKDESNDGKDITDEEVIDCGLKQMVCSLKLMFLCLITYKLLISIAINYYLYCVLGKDVIQVIKK
jgi:hypothetical protein